MTILSGLRQTRWLVLGPAVVLLVAAAVFAWRAHSLRDDPDLANRAQLDQATQRQVTTAVSRDLTRVLSYDWQQPAATRAAASQVLAGQARKEYDTLFASLQKRAPGQKLTLTAEVKVAAVQRLTDSRATLLVFLDQSSTRAKDKQSSISAAQLQIRAERHGSTWQITGLQPL